MSKVLSSIVIVLLLLTVSSTAYAKLDNEAAWRYLDVFNEYCEELSIPLRGSLSADPAIAIITNGWRYNTGSNKSISIEDAILGSSPTASMQLYYIPHEDCFIFTTDYHTANVRLMTVYTDYGIFFPEPQKISAESLWKTKIRFTAEQIRYMLYSSDIRIEIITDYDVRTLKFSPSKNDLIVYSSFIILDCFSYSDTKSTTFSKSINYTNMDDYLYLLEN